MLKSPTLNFEVITNLMLLYLKLYFVLFPEKKLPGKWFLGHVLLCICVDAQIVYSQMRSRWSFWVFFLYTVVEHWWSFKSICLWHLINIIWLMLSGKVLFALITIRQFSLTIVPYWTCLIEADLFFPKVWKEPCFSTRRFLIMIICPLEVYAN